MLSMENHTASSDCVVAEVKAVRFLIDTSESVSLCDCAVTDRLLWQLVSNRNSAMAMAKMTSHGTLGYPFEV